MKNILFAIVFLFVLPTSAVIRNNGSEYVLATKTQQSENLKSTQLKTDSLIPEEIVSFSTSGKYAVSYHVYTPSNFNPASPPPMVVAFSAGGRGKSLLQSFRVAAETMGWIGVGCDTLRNGMQDPIAEVEIEDELLDEILNTIPHDSERLYLTGGSGGAMRSYGITARRPEKFAGVIAHGGWLGGLDYQNEPYPEGMSIAMLNGNLDMGAGAWTIMDTNTLRKRNCTVKHFTCMGGHVVAPASVTLIAMQWLEEQWIRKSTPKESKNPLKILFVGNSAERTRLYKTFLEKHFASVKTIIPDSVNLDRTNEADILVLDDAAYNLPDNYNKAMLLIGPTALNTAKRFGSKVKSAGICTSVEVLKPDSIPEIFKTPYSVNPKYVRKTYEGNASQIEIFRLVKSNSAKVLLMESQKLEGTEDSEVLLKGIDANGKQRAIIAREASRLFWGDSTTPGKMTSDARKIFINSLLWIYPFDGLRQSEMSGITPRDSIKSIIAKIDLKAKDALRWFPEDILIDCAYDKQKLQEYYTNGLPYIITNYGSGQLRVDELAKKYGTPNNDPSSIKVWIDSLATDRKNANSLLFRYTNQRIRNTEQWSEWYTVNKDKLTFRDEKGYVFECE